MNIQTQIDILSNMIKAYEDLAQYAAECPKDYAGEYSDAKDLLTFLKAERDAPEDFLWLRLKSDGNGNPRHQTRIDYFVTDAERNFGGGVKTYAPAEERVKALGGRINKGGVVFSSYNRGDLVKRIGEIVGRNYKSVE